MVVRIQESPFIVNIMNLFPVQTLMQSLPTQVKSVNLLLCVSQKVSEFHVGLHVV